MSRKNWVWAAHLVLFGVFLTSAALGLVAWLISDEIQALAVGATIAAFVATTSVFVDRLFPDAE